MSKYTEAIADILGLIKPTTVIFEEEKESLWTAVEALQIADRLEHADARENVGKRLGEMEEWVRVSTNGYSYFKGYAQALADIRGDEE